MTSELDRRESETARRIENLVLIVTAVDVEKDAILRGLRGDRRFHVIAAGVGPAAAAAGTATALALAQTPYTLVISAGIAGGFIGRAEVGSLVIADDIVAADLGAETAEGFESVDKLGFGSARIQPDGRLVDQVTEAIRSVGLPVMNGAVLTVSTVTGTAASAVELAARVPGAAAEGMEGFGVATAAKQSGVPVLEIRSISNPVGPRDRASWRIGEALAVLEAASTVLLEVIE